MSYTTENTIWPEQQPVDPSIRDLIALFYELADDKAAEAGSRLASEVFAENASMIAATGKFQGSDGAHKFPLFPGPRSQKTDV